MDRKLCVHLKNENSDAILEDLKLRSVVKGLFQETTLQMIFRNPLDKDTEGELVIPLEEGAAVCGYAVDIQGQLVDAVVCEKETARNAFESEVRDKKSGPSIAEHVVGNLFKTRIYPLPQKGTRTIKVIYMQELTAKSDRATFTLPLQSWLLGDNNLKSFQLEARLETEKEPLKIVNNGGLGRYLQIQRIPTDSSHKGVIHSATMEISEKFRITSNLDITFQPINSLVEHETNTDTYYFCLHDNIPPIKPQSNVSTSKPVGLFWDCSLSAKTEKSLEFSILEKILGNFKEIDVVSFSNTVISSERFSNKNSVIDHLKGRTYDGGTDIINVLENIGDKYSMVLLFSDGVVTCGKEVWEKITVPIYSFSNSNVTNDLLLKKLAKDTGGQHFNLKNVSSDTIVGTIGRSSSGVHSVVMEINKVQWDVYPWSPIIDVSGSQFKIIGQVKLPISEEGFVAMVTMRYGTWGNSNSSLETKVYSVSFENVPQVQFFSHKSNEISISRFWAKKKIDELLVTSNNKDDILLLGRTFNIVTPETSLIVMETLDQFVKYKIQPPQHMTHIYNQYMSLIKEEEKNKQKEIDNKMFQVQDMWSKRVFWWENYIDFAYRTPQLDYVHDAKVFDEYESLKLEKIAVTDKKIYSESLLQMVGGSADTLDDLQEAFSLIDSENNGKITVNQIKKLFSSLGETVDDIDIPDVVDGKLDFEGFVKAVSYKEEDYKNDEEIPVSTPTFAPFAPAYAAAPVTCFVKGTPITMATGATVAIEEISIGDSILSYNFKLKQVEAVPVLEIIRPVHNKTVKLTFLGNTSSHILENTVDHPYYIVSKGCWGAVEPRLHGGVRAIKLNIGDTCLGYFGEKKLEHVTLVSIETIQHENGIQTWNLSHVAKNNCFFAGGILVHNKRTKQTARKSTGGKAPRQMIAHEPMGLPISAPDTYISTPASNLGMFDSMDFLPAAPISAGPGSMPASTIPFPTLNMPPKSSKAFITGKLFGSTPSNAIDQMKNTMETLEKREKFLEDRISKERSVARSNASTNKSEALFNLKRAKQLESQVEQIDKARFQLETQLMTLESASASTESLQAMKLGASSMRSIHRDLSIDHVDDLLSDISEQMEISQEINQALSAPISFDDEELMDELAELEADMLDSNLLSIPTSSYKENSKKKMSTIIEEEEEELRMLEESMGFDIPAPEKGRKSNKEEKPISLPPKRAPLIPIAKIPPTAPPPIQTPYAVQHNIHVDFDSSIKSNAMGVPLSEVSRLENILSDTSRIPTFSSLSSQNTKRNTVVGTSYWLSPETINDSVKGEQIEIQNKDIRTVTDTNTDPQKILQNPQKIGEGAAGEVILATDAITGKKIAVKRLFFQEISVLGNLGTIIELIKEINSENILNVERVLIKDNVLFICQETSVSTLTELLECYESIKMHEYDIAAIVRAVAMVTKKEKRC